MTPGAGPRAQVQRQVGVGAGDEQVLAGCQGAQGPVDQEVAAPVEADIPQGGDVDGGEVGAQGRYPVAVTRPCAS